VGIFFSSIFTNQQEIAVPSGKTVDYKVLGFSVLPSGFLRSK